MNPTEPDHTERLIARLALETSPVSKVPLLRTVAMGVALAAITAAALKLAISGLRPDWTQQLTDHPSFAMAVVSLGMTGIGGVLAGLASCIPGRDTALRAGLGLALAGTALACGLAAALLTQSSFANLPEPPLSDDLVCFSAACLVAIPAALSLLVFGMKCAVIRPWLTASAAALGAVGLAAIAVHMTCSYAGVRHLLLSHVAAPLLGGALLAVPFYVALRSSPSASSR